VPASVPFGSLERGYAVPEFALSLSHDDVLAYLDATGEAPERWGERVPPLMLIAHMLAGLLERVSIPLTIMHTGQEFEVRRGARIGEPLTVQLSMVSHSVRRGAIIAAFDGEVRSGDG
jgi:hypothetical protein